VFSVSLIETDLQVYKQMWLWFSCSKLHFRCTFVYYSLY